MNQYLDKNLNVEFYDNSFMGIEKSSFILVHFGGINFKFSSTMVKVPSLIDKNPFILVHLEVHCF